MTDKPNNITLQVSDAGAMGAYVAWPADDGTRHPAIMVLQEALGVNRQLRSVADRFAHHGFVAIAPDLFHRTRPGYQATKLVRQEIMPLIHALTTDGLIADVRAAYDWLIDQETVDTEKIACVGFCMGGRATYLANSELPLAAAISYYGGSIAPALLDRAANLRAPHLFFWGGQDQGIPPEQHRAVIDAVRAAGKSYVNVEFSEANHGFFNEELEDRYNKPAATMSWAMAMEFLADALA